MVQEFYVLKCVDCNIYQVNIVKKSKKWSCVVCSRKQSVMTVYFSGSSKDCRKQAQKLNRINIERETVSNSETDYCVLELSEENDFIAEENDGEKNSKWNKYIDLTDECDNETITNALDAEESEIIIVNEDTLLDYDEKEEILEEDPLLCLEEEINTTDNEGTDASFILRHSFDDSSVVVISSLSFFENLEPDEIINEVVPTEEAGKKLSDNGVSSVTGGNGHEKKLNVNHEVIKNGVDFCIPDEEERFYINEFNLEGYRNNDANDVLCETAASSSVDLNENDNNEQLKMNNEQQLPPNDALKYEIVEVFEHSSPPPTKIRKQFNGECVVSFSDVDDNELSRTRTDSVSVSDSEPCETRNQTKLTKQRSSCLVENIVISGKKKGCNPGAESNKNSAAATTIPDKKSLRLEVDDVSKYNVKVIIPNVVKENGLNPASSSSSSRVGLKTAKETLLKTNLTRSKLRRLIEDIPSLPLIKHSTTCSEECLALVDKEFPLDETSDDEEYRPASYHRNEKADDDENDGCEVADIADANKRAREKRPATSSSVNDGRNSPKDNYSTANSKQAENSRNNVCHRTRSKLPLENTPIELIEHSFVFPDITTDMYETECDDTEWVNFLKQFAEPINNAEPDANDDEGTDDPEFVIDETGNSRQVEEDDVEELRNDSSVKISKKELEDLLNGLFEDNTTSVNESVADYEIDDNEDDDARDCSNNDRSKSDCSAALNSLSVRKVNVVTSAFTVAQLELLKQQIRQHIQLNTQHFVQCYKHPVWCKVADKFESMLNDFKYLSFNSSQSCYNAFNLSHAFTFIERWKDYVKNKDDYYFRHHKFKFDTRMMMMICSAESLFLYPLLLPTRPPLWQRNLYIENVLTEPEEKLISLALEEFADFVFEQNLLNTDNGNTVTSTTAAIATSSGGRSSAFLDLQNLSGIVKLIREHLMPFRSALSLEDYIKEKHRSKSMNPIKYYFVHRKAYPVVNYVIPLTASSLRALWYQPEQLLTTVWKHFVQEQKSVKPITRTIPILPK